MNIHDLKEDDILKFSFTVDKEVIHAVSVVLEIDGAELEFKRDLYCSHTKYYEAGVSSLTILEVKNPENLGTVDTVERSNPELFI